MRILLQELVGNTTALLKCPPLTRETDKDDEKGCVYNDWAYALFALVALIIVGIPFVAFICYVHRRIRNKQRTRRPSHTTSLENSSPYPYQPLHSDGGGSHANYGAMDSSVDDHLAVRSPSHASTASLTDRISQQQDTASVASSRASVIPTYDDVSLNYRNAVASKTQGGGANQPAGKASGRRLSRSSHLSTDSQEKAVDQGGQFYDSVDVVSNVPKLQNHTIPKDLKQPPRKPPRQQVVTEANTATTENPVYDEVEGSEQNVIFQPSSFGVPGVDAPSMVSRASKPNEDGDSPGSGDKGPHGSPLYAVLEPQTDTTADQSQVNDNEQKGLLPDEQKLSTPDDKPQDTEVTAESPPSENKYLTVLPPTPPKENEPSSENAARALQSSGGFDELSVSPTDKSAAKSRTDFEEFLLGKVRAMPADERNGTFLIRDSVSSTGSKVLTMYSWKAESNKELYNFKVCLTEDGQVYLSKSSRKFSDLNGLVKYLREHKDMLPCVLKTQVFP